MKINRVIVIGFILILTACAQSSGVVPLGGDSYMISRSEKGFDVTGSAVKADALKEANSYCQAQGKELQLIKAVPKDMVPFRSDAQAEIEFKCQ
ncbi:hypothetical protein [Shewanella aquimarina]|uniref:hypothetical protein n=1 Tax=Shewanella aquimarina TaxID=260365 RepID=UPI002014C892|nr:hypothetical protein [Shewanella aquimarina]MCL2910775.1 hypothetical protein [Shewanella aquimarina]